MVRLVRKHLIYFHWIMEKQKSRFIVFEGIAGSGKSTIIRATKLWLSNQGYRIFDMKKWIEEHNKPPELSNFKNADVLLTFEPTKQWIGAAIRYEMSQTKNPYSGTELAQAFALDRLIQYKRIILPALKAGKTIIQDRSVGTSIAYQPIMPGGCKLEDLIALSGNALAIANAPDHLIITNINPARIQERLNRDDDSKGVFENIEFMKKTHERYNSDWFENIFKEQGTQIHQFNTDIPIENMGKNAKNLISTLLKE